MNNNNLDPNNLGPTNSASNNQNYNSTQHNNQNSEQQNYTVPPNNTIPPVYTKEPKNNKKSILPIVLTAIITFIVLVGALYFGYNKFLKKENVINLATYEVNFVTYGTEGEGKPEVDIKKIPEVANSSAEISNFLSTPDISFNKQRNLKNGDKVEVTIALNKNTSNKLKLKTTGEFRRTFTVNGLNEKAKEKETIIVKEGASNSSNPSDSASSSNEVRHSVSGRTAYVKPSVGVNLRSDKNDTSKILTSIKGGASVTIRTLETNSSGESWAYVYYGSHTGYIRADLLGGF